jgi:hypothetical protein
MILRTNDSVWLETMLRRPLLSIAIVMLTALLLVACGASETTEAPTPTPAAIPLPSPVVEPTPAPEGAYPGPGAPAAPVDGYPAPAPVLPAPPSNYPGDTTWLVRPAGIQCEEPLYADLEAAVTALQASGAPVITAETVTLPVCQGCGCPTSEHYRVEIPAAAMNTAAAMEWFPE